MELTAEFQYMMHLAGCAALGKTPEPPTAEIDWKQVLTFASEQTVLTLVQYAIKKAPFDIPDEIRQSATVQLNRLTTQAYIRKIGVLQVLAELEKQGIKAAVVKGFAIARDYAVPDIRISSDADVYISENDEEAALKVFESFGFTYRKREKFEKDTGLRHPKFGLVELHVRLFDDFVQKYWHDGKDFGLLEPYRWQETPDGGYYTLGHTDQFLFVLEHMMKHFIEDGTSLRMILDVGILLRAHEMELDNDRIKEFVCRRKYETAIQTFLKILESECGFVFGNTIAHTDVVSGTATTVVLEDMETGGVRGMKKNDSNSMKDGLRVYNSTQRKNNRTFLGLSVNYYEVLRLLFPLKKTMINKYPWLKKAPVLYPFAWLHRLVFRGIYHVIKKDVAIKNWRFDAEEAELTPSVGTQRAELFRMLDMM